MIKKLSAFLAGAALTCLASCTPAQKEASTKEYTPIEVTVPERPTGQQDVIELTAPKLDTVRVGFIGLGMRGPSAVERWTHIPGTKIVALCDLVPENAEKAQKIVTHAGMEAPALYSGNEDAWKQLCERDDIDLVYIVTDWKHHAEMGVYAMEHGKHAAIEVPAAMTLDEIWALVNTSEKTRKHCMQLENCVYDFFELTTLNMAQKGLFGEVLHAEGSYIHNLEEFWPYYRNNWRLDYNRQFRGDVYATHGLGPACQLLDIHRGDRPRTGKTISERRGSRFPERRPYHDLYPYRKGKDHPHSARCNEPASLQPYVPADRNQRVCQQVSHRRVLFPSGPDRQHQCARPREPEHALGCARKSERGPDDAIQTSHPSGTGRNSQESGRTRRHGLYHGLPPGILPAQRTAVGHGRV